MPRKHGELSWAARSARFRLRDYNRHDRARSLSVLKPFAGASRTRLRAALRARSFAIAFARRVAEDPRRDHRGAASPRRVPRDGGGEAGARGAFGRQKIRGAIMEAIGRM